MAKNTQGWGNRLFERFDNEEVSVVESVVAQVKKEMWQI